MKSLFEREVARTAPTPRFKIIRHDSGKHKAFTLYSYEQASVWGPDRYAQEIERAKREVRIPVIASINCITDAGWRDYARRMESAGADALEINVSCPHGSVTFSGEAVVETTLNVVQIVRSAVRIPIFPKLSPQLSMPAALVKAIEDLRADGVVLFNRLTGLDIDVEREEPVMHGGYAGHGGPWAIQYPLRWISEVYPKTRLPIAGSGGVCNPEDVVKYILAGATVVQVCTAIYLQGYGVLKRLNHGLRAWMAAKGYQRVEEFRGKVSGAKILGIDQVRRIHDKVARVNPNACSGCGACERVCIYFAPRKAGDVYEITADCDGCGLCAELCPKAAISMVTTSRPPDSKAVR
jgi:dihydroorotate dehydrogenase (fumarate)